MQVDPAPRSDTRPLTIGCLNVKFSQNLGDGLLCECLEAALVQHGAAPETRSVDLAGRPSYGTQMPGRKLAMNLLNALPTAIRHRAIRIPLGVQTARSWRPHYRSGLDDADAAVIGGGNLLSDHDLNFPTKLGAAIQVLADRGIPYAIFACGMAERWTAEGERRLMRGFERAPPVAVYLRDSASKTRWDDRFGAVCGQRAVVVRDPGLLASKVYSPGPAVPPGTVRIGVGVMSHVAIKYHSDTPMAAGDLLQWYVSLVHSLADRGAEVAAFTNGAPEDAAMADALSAALSGCGIEAGVFRPQLPVDLARHVASCSAITAYRMHAIIAAHSFGVPSVPLAWDDKVAAFADSVGRSDWLIDPASVPPAHAADLVLRAAKAPIPMAERDAVVAEARQDVGRLYAALSTVS